MSKTNCCDAASFPPCCPELKKDDVCLKRQQVLVYIALEEKKQSNVSMLHDVI